MASKVALMCEVGKGDVVVDNTLLKSTTCSTRVAMRHILHLDSPKQKWEADVGSAIHAGVATWLLGGVVGEKAVRRGVEAMRECYPAGTPPDERLVVGNVVRIVTNWMETHPREKLPIVVEQVEVGMGHELLPAREDRPRVVMVAILDAYGKRKVGGGPWSIDWKSSSNPTEWWKMRQEDASQYTGQKWIADKRGVVLAGIYVGGIHIKKLSTYKARCPTHSCAYSECTLRHLGHVMHPVTRTPHEVVAWERTTKGLVRKFLKLRATVRDIHDVRELPMEGRFAEQCQFCEFRQWCRTGRQAKGHELVERKWDPVVVATERHGRVAV